MDLKAVASTAGLIIVLGYVFYNTWWVQGIIAWVIRLSQ